MRTLCLLACFLLCMNGAAQPYFQSVQLTTLHEGFVPAELSIPMQNLYQTGHGRPNGKDATPVADALRFGMKGGVPLNRDLKFNNVTPGWMQYNLEQHSITIGGFDAPTYQPDAHGVIPRTMERMYRDADAQQRDPLPKKQ